MNFLNDLTFFIPELYISFSLIFILIDCVVIQKYNQNSVLAINYSSKYILISLFFSLILLLKQPKHDVDLINMLFSNNEVSFLSKILIIVLFFFLSLIFISYYKVEAKSLSYGYEYPVLMLLSILGMFLLISSNDFLVLFLGIELQSLALYVLASSKKNTLSSLESGLKYFVMGAFSSGIILLGISLIYGVSGMTNFNDIKYFLLSLKDIEQTTFNVCIIAFSFVLVGLLFKLPAAPFHSWALDVYTGSPTAITAFFSVVPKIAIFSVLIKILYSVFFSLSAYWSFYLAVSAVCSLIIGSMGALYNVNLKRIMAYSTINHVGFILLSLSTASVEGVQASLFYITIYLILNLNFFSILLSLRNKNKIRSLNNITDLSILFYKHPVLAIFLIFNLFSMAGIPPLSGFFSKFYVLYSMMRSDMIFLSVFAVFISVVSCFYYIRMVKTSMFESDEYISKKDIIAVPDDFSFVMLITTLFNILFFINPNFLLSLCYMASYNLFS